MEVNGTLKITADRQYARYMVKCSTGETIPLGADGAPPQGVVLTVYVASTEGVMSAYTAGKVSVDVTDGLGPLARDEATNVSSMDVTDVLEEASQNGPILSLNAKVYNSGGELLAAQSFGTVRNGQNGEPGDDGVDADAVKLLLSSGYNVLCTAYGALKSAENKVTMTVNGSVPSGAAISVELLDERDAVIASKGQIGNPYDFTNIFNVQIQTRKKAPYKLRVTGTSGAYMAAEIYDVMYDTPPYVLRPETEWSAGLTFRNGDILALDLGQKDEDNHAKLSVFMWNYPASGNSTTPPLNDTVQHPDTTHWATFSSFGMLATRLFFAQYALVKNLGVETVEVTGDGGSITMKDDAGNILFQAKGGNVACNTGTFKNINVTDGSKIGGLLIQGNALSNEGLDNNAYVVMRNDPAGKLAGVGSLSETVGNNSVARFAVTKQGGLNGTNVAMTLEASGATYNFAYLGTGNGVLDGMVCGYKFCKFTCTAPNKIYDNNWLNGNSMWVVAATVSNSGVTLPRLADVRRTLGVAQGGQFCAPLTLMGDLGTTQLTVYGRNDNADSSGSHPWNTSEYPVLTDVDGHRRDSIPLKRGESVTFMLVYDGSNTGTLDGYDLKYTARMVNWLHQ